jgi:hypothetical protein
MMEIGKRTKVLEGANCGQCDNAAENGGSPVGLTKPTVRKVFHRTGWHEAELVSVIKDIAPPLGSRDKEEG